MSKDLVAVLDIHFTFRIELRIHVDFNGKQLLSGHVSWRHYPLNPCVAIRSDRHRNCVDVHIRPLQLSKRCT